MFDDHLHPEGWGLLPYIEVFGVRVSTYGLMIVLGIVAAAVFYKWQVRGLRKDDRTILIPLSAIFFGALGAKLPAMIELKMRYSQATTTTLLYSSGRTILGGLIGGLIGVKLIKSVLKIEDKRGNELAPAIALGMIFGRMGCFLQGCCYGIATGMGVGVNFGDGVLRHPTQVYEMVFHGIAFVWLLRADRSAYRPGALLRLYFIAYFMYRFISEFIRIHPDVLWGMSGYQVASLLFAILLTGSLWKGEKHGEPVGE